MNPSDLEKVSAKLPLSKATLARNTDLGAGCSGVDKGVTTMPARVQDNIAFNKGLNMIGGGDGVVPTSLPLKPKKRLKQSSKPLMNKLESGFFTWLRFNTSAISLRPKGKTYRLANGLKYTPDFTGQVSGKETCWEVKGPKAWDDAIVKLKVAAHEWPDVDWFLCWKQDGIWQIQKILP